MTLPNIRELPERVLHTYARLWRLETWLRRLVYVELRAKFGEEWKSHATQFEKPKEADKRLTHMPTPEDNPLSYMQFSGLCKVIDENWALYEFALPPQSIWHGKLEEIKQIRHRVAHFRLGHEDDLVRVQQLLRDLDGGFRKFCISYNDAYPIFPVYNDSIGDHFRHLDPFPWSDLGEGCWGRIGMVGPDVGIALTVGVIKRPWAKLAMPAIGNEGLFYDVTITARSPRCFDYPYFLTRTAELEKQIVHVCLDGTSSSIRILIPAVSSETSIIALVDEYRSASINSLRHSLVINCDVQALADAWPEYILGPDDPLSFFTKDFPGRFFEV